MQYVPPCCFMPSEPCFRRHFFICWKSGIFETADYCPVRRVQSLCHRLLFSTFSSATISFSAMVCPFCLILIFPKICPFFYRGGNRLYGFQNLFCHFRFFMWQSDVGFFEEACADGFFCCLRKFGFGQRFCLSDIFWAYRRPAMPGSAACCCPMRGFPPIPNLV